MKPVVHADFNRHTCIELGRSGNMVDYIPLSIEGLDLQRMTEAEFDRAYKPLQDYPADRAAKLYTEFALESSGATKEAMQALAKLTTLTPKEIEMATAKKSTVKEPAKKAAPAKAAKPAAKVAPTKTTKPAAKAERAPRKTADGKPSCAERFRELIVEGKLDDDAIFAKVQKEYGLDDDKRRYVSFYRFDCKRKGLIK